MKRKLTFFAAIAGMATMVAADPYEAYRGTTLTVSWPTLGHFNAAETVIEEFEAETGINVEVEAIPYLGLRERQISEMSKPESDFDLVSYVIMWKSEYVENGLLEPLVPFFLNNNLAEPDYDIDDIARPYLVSGGMVGGNKGYLDGPGSVLYGIPFGAETSILAYRADIFEKHEITEPKTYAQLKAAIERLSALGIQAMTSRGRSGNDVTFAWLLHLGPMGGKVFDQNWEPTINAPEAVEAAEFLRLVVDTGPDNIETFNFGQSTFSFLTGGAAIYLDNFKVAAASRDPNFAVFADQIKYASHPSGVRCSAETGGFAMGIPANSQNQEAAFLLLQYLTSKKGDRRTTELGGDPVRISTFVEFQGKRKESGAVIESLLCADTDWRPLVPEWNDIQTKVLGPALLEVVQTKRPVPEIMNEANAALRQLMAEAGYYEPRG